MDDEHESDEATEGTVDGAASPETGTPGPAASQARPSGPAWELAAGRRLRPVLLPLFPARRRDRHGSWRLDVGASSTPSASSASSRRPRRDRRGSWRLDVGASSTPSASSRRARRDRRGSWRLDVGASSTSSRPVERIGGGANGLAPQGRTGLSHRRPSRGGFRFRPSC